MSLEEFELDKKKIQFKDLFIGAAKTPFIEFFRSLFVGGVAFVADFGVLTLLKEAFSLDTILASTLGFCVGVIVNYIMSAFWAFKQSNVKNALLRFAIFVAIAIVGLLINNAIIDLFDGTLAERRFFGTLLNPDYYYMAGKIVATVVVFFWNFFSRKLLLFRGEKKDL